jgi:competence protein ComEA
MLFGCAVALSALHATSVTAADSSMTPPPATRSADPVAEIVNINTADAYELERLPGIGPSRARAILELRTRTQGFKHLEDLMRVKGIGRATFRKLRPFLTLTGPTTRGSHRAKRAELRGTTRDTA